MKNRLATESPRFHIPQGGGRVAPVTDAADFGVQLPIRDKSD
jgi:hypothetical protein